MALARTYAVALLGVDGHVIEVEADLGNGIPGLSIIGLPDTSLYEARDRVKAAIVNSGESWPQRRITLGLSPASLRKTGSSFDLAIDEGCREVRVVLVSCGGVCPTKGVTALVDTPGSAWREGSAVTETIEPMTAVIASEASSRDWFTGARAVRDVGDGFMGCLGEARR